MGDFAAQAEQFFLLGFEPGECSDFGWVGGGEPRWRGGSRDQLRAQRRVFFGDPVEVELLSGQRRDNGGAAYDSECEFGFGVAADPQGGGPDEVQVALNQFGEGLFIALFGIAAKQFVIGVGVHRVVSR